MFNTGTSKTKFVHKEYLLFLSFFLFSFLLFIFLYEFKQFFLKKFIWVWSGHCCNTDVTCRYVPDVTNLKKKREHNFVIWTTTHRWSWFEHNNRLNWSPKNLNRVSQCFWVLWDHRLSSSQYFWSDLCYETFVIN